MITENSLTPVELIIPSDSGLEIESIQSLENLFKPLFQQAEEWRLKALACKVTDINDKRGMKFARESRLALRAIRIEVEKRRKTAKEDSLRKGKAIDGMANIFKAAVEPIEQFLLEQEEFAERHEAARIAALQEERAKVIAPFLGEGQPVALLGMMSGEQWDSYLSDARLLHQAKIDAAKKAEEERIAREQAEAAERERMAAENERLKREAAEREEAARIERERVEAERRAEREKAAREAAEAAEKARQEREAIEAKAKAEREAAARKQAQERAAREKAEREAAELREAEERRQREEAERVQREAAEQAEAERKAANAPEKDKLLAFAQQVRGLTVPAVSTLQAQAVANEIASKVESFARWIEAQTKNL